MPYQINVKETETLVIKIANNFVAFEIGESASGHYEVFFDGAFTLKSFLKAYKTIEIKGYFPYE